MSEAKECAVTGCKTPATHEKKVEGENLSFDQGRIKLPNASFSFQAWLCDNRTLNDTGFVQIPG